MVWFKVDDILPFHERVLEAGNAAMGLWVRAGAWSSGQLTDGYIPRSIARQLGSPTEIKRLVQTGLWYEVEAGFQFHAWAEDGTGAKRQPTRAEIEAKRKAERDRKAAYRDNRKDTAGVSEQRPAGVPVGQTVGRDPESQWASEHPGPTRPDPTSLPSEGGRAGATAPSPFCPIHPDGTTDPCRACGDARRAFAAWTPPPATPRTVKHIPGLCDAHRQREGECEMCERENTHAARVLVGVFGGAA